MKILSALALTALLGTSAAFAANTASTAPSTGAAATAPAAAPAKATTKHMSTKACNKKADEQKLTGDDRAKFVKDCHSGKAAK